MTTTLHHGDCLEKMKLIPDKSVDLIICDLPYGCLTPPRATKSAGWIKVESETGEKAPLKRINEEVCAWDIKIDLEPFWREVKRIRKNEHTACIHFCSTRFGVDLINSNPKEFRYDIVWNKMCGVGFLSVNKKPMSGHEMIYIFSNKGSNYNRIDIKGDFEKWLCGKNGVRGGNHADANLPKKNISGGEGKRCVTSVIECKGARSNQKGEKKEFKHPTEKPLDLYKWLISRYSNEGDTVLDPTFGSGNSGIVCKELNRNYIGIEMNEEFFNKARDKLPITNTLI